MNPSARKALGRSSSANVRKEFLHEACAQLRAAVDTRHVGPRFVDENDFGGIDPAAARRAPRCPTLDHIGADPARWQSASFSRLLQRGTSGADCRQANFFAAARFQFSLQLTQINIRPSRDLRDEPIRPGMPFRLTWRLPSWGDLAGLSTLLLDARIHDCETPNRSAISRLSSSSTSHAASTSPPNSTPYGSIRFTSLRCTSTYRAA